MSLPGLPPLCLPILPCRTTSEVLPCPSLEAGLGVWGPGRLGLQARSPPPRPIHQMGGGGALRARASRFRWGLWVCFVVGAATAPIPPPVMEDACGAPDFEGGNRGLGRQRPRDEQQGV